MTLKIGNLFNQRDIKMPKAIQDHPLFMAACNKVAGDWRELAYAILLDDAYASHVSQDIKCQHLTDMLGDADLIQQGKVKSFTIWQRVNIELTGECVALLA